MIQRAVVLWQRNQRAREFGISFERSSRFSMPSSVYFRRNRQPISAPPENGIKMAFIDIFLDDCYGLRKLKLPIRRILDIGAHVGLFSLAARNFFSDAEIHAYEPNPQIEIYLKEQARTGNFKYFMEAVGFEDGKVGLDLHEDSVQTRSKEDQKGDIPKVAFHSAIERLGGNVDFLKMDCEGAEWEIFRDKESFHKVQNLAMEFHLWPNHTSEEVQRAVTSLGFKIKKIKLLTNHSGLLIATRHI